MGIYDREYYRRDKSGFLGSWADNGQCWKLFILVNIAIFVIQVITQQKVTVGGPDFEDEISFLKMGPFTNALKLDTAAVLHGEIWRLVTYAFLHDPADVMHILFNLFFFWMFAPFIEDIYGSREFVALYFGVALVGGLAFVFFNLLGVPGGQCLGASGVVMAMVVLCALHDPTRVIMLFMIIPVPIWFFVIFALAPDAYHFLNGLVHKQATGRTAVTVHLAGAAFSYAYYKRQWRLSTLFSGVPSFRFRRSRPKLRVYHGEEQEQPVAVVTTSAPEVDEHLEAQLDAVLEKVARTGKDSLTESENEILLRASAAYRKRRT